MADQTEPTRFRAHFESALHAYYETTGVSLAGHPLALQLQNPHSIESVITMLKDGAPASRDLLESDKIMKALESTIRMLFSLSATTSFGDTIGLVRKEVLIPWFTHP
jgi:hypothetical protein